MPERFRLMHASGECEIDLARRELLVLGAPVPVGGRTFDILEVLARSAGQLVTKDELMKRVWPDAIVTENTLHVHALALRKALGPHRTTLQTVSGRGFRLTGRWHVHGDGEATVRSREQPPLSNQPFITNLPAAASGLIGREAAVAHVRDLLSAYRAVTLTGTGGIGKTALALEVARSLVANFQGDVWLVDLGSIANASLLPSAVAGVLGLQPDGELTHDFLARAIGDSRTFIILDNCEHVIDAAAGLAITVARRCPHATILATSREALRIEGEHVYRVPPLDVPSSDETEPEDLLARGAIRLFVTRSDSLEASDNTWQHENLMLVAAICRHLDGIPLAIEFAAARAAAIGVQRVASSLGDRFALLTHGRRTALPRHRTLRATFDWSYDLLPEEERLLFRRLAIFAGGFTLDAVTAVMSGTGLDPSVIAGGIANLAAKSLVGLDRAEGSARWYLLETTRAYALEKLNHHDQANTVARYHAAYLRDLITPSADRSNVLLERCVQEIDNVRGALNWCFSAAGDREIGVDLTTAYAPVWLHLSLRSESRERCEGALLNGAPDVTQSLRLQMWSRIERGRTLIDTTGPSEQAQTVLASALKDANDLGDLNAQVLTLSAVAAVNVHRGEYGAARNSLERLSRVAERIGDPAIIGVAHRRMGTTLLTLGRPGEAQQYLESALRTLDPAQGQRHSAWFSSEQRAIAKAMLARSLWLRGFAEAALREARASLDDLRQNDRQIVICRIAYFGVCRIAPMIGDFAEAERWIARSIEISTRLKALFWQTAARFLHGKLLVERREFAKAVPILRDAFETCRRTGWRISWPEFKGALAVSLAALGQLNEAFDAVNDAVISAGNPEDGQVWYLPELLRIKGELLLQLASETTSAEADACFQEALLLAQKQEALFWELRISLSVARARVAAGRHQQARQVLAPVYERFTRDFETTDLRTAKTLLDTITPRGIDN